MSIVVDNARIRKLLRAYPVGAIEILFELYSRNLFKLANKMCRDRETAKDIVQDTFIHVWENRAILSQDHKSSIEAYMARVVRNMAITYFKKVKPYSLEYLQELHGDRIGDIDFSTEDAIVRNEMIQEIRRFIETFPTKEKECLLMKIDRNLTMDEIAEELKVTRKAVERSVTSGQKRLKSWASRRF